MKYPSSEKSIIALDAWLETPAGNYVRAWERARLHDLTSDIFGFNAVQIGLPKIDALQANRMPNKWCTNRHLPSQETTEEEETRIVVAHDFAELPFASQSIDLVILPHILEFAAEPHQVLREVERILIPEGQVIICGFNPTSLWGLRQTVGRLTHTNFLPEDGEFISLPRLKDWLTLLNMEITRTHFGCYVPPCQRETWINRLSVLDKAGTHWWPYFGAVYMVQAIKRVRGMHLIGPAWQKNSQRVPKGVPATNKFPRTKHGQD